MIPLSTGAEDAGGRCSEASPAGRSTTRVERRPCEICGTSTQSIGYKAFVCGACSIFYRRNFRNHHRIVCRNGGHCNLQVGNRNSCRGCRMRQCRALGLRMVGSSLVVQCNGYPKDDIEDDSQLTVIRASDDFPVQTQIAHQPAQRRRPSSKPQPVKEEASMMPTPSCSGGSPPELSTTMLATEPAVHVQREYVQHGYRSIPCAGVKLESHPNGTYPRVITSLAGPITKDPSSTSSGALNRLFSTAVTLPNGSSTTYSPPSVQSCADSLSAPASVQPPVPTGVQHAPLPAEIAGFTAAENALIDDFFVDAVFGLRPTTAESPDELGVARERFPTLAHTARVFQRFEQRELCLASICRGCEVDLATDYAYITMTIYSIMENRTLRLVCKAVGELLAEIPVLAVPDRARILNAVMPEVSSHYKLALTSRFFPQHFDHHMALFPGFYCRLDEFVGFMKNDYNQTKHCLQPLWDVGKDCIERFRNVKPNFVEMAALGAALVWETVERLHLMNPEASRARDRLYRELADWLLEKHGDTTVAMPRFGRLMSLMYDVKAYCSTYDDAFQVLGVFLPTDRDIFWKHKPTLSSGQIMHLASSEPTADSIT